jgi:hypothetical protein
MNIKKPWRRRLSVDIPITLYDKIKTRAGRRHLLLTRYITRALFRYLMEESKYENESDHACTCNCSKI